MQSLTIEKNNCAVTRNLNQPQKNSFTKNVNKLNATDVLILSGTAVLGVAGVMRCLKSPKISSFFNKVFKIAHDILEALSY